MENVYKEDLEYHTLHTIPKIKEKTNFLLINTLQR